MKSFLDVFQSLLIWVMENMNSLSLQILVAMAIMFLFMLGYVSHSLLGNNNPVEEVAEQLLKDDYGVEVEFSGK